MRVIVPFAVSDHSWSLAATHLALRQDGVQAEFFQMRGDNAYFDLVEGLWREQESFIVVEHDIVVYPGAIQSLVDCVGWWCTLPYFCSVGWIVDGLGCTKFDSRLMQEFPDFFQEPFPACCKHTRHYCGLDRLIAHRMAELGKKSHVHMPGVCNLNEKWT